MSQLVKNPEKAAELREHLQQQAGKGHEWVVYDTDNPIDSKYDLHCFPDETEALDFAREYQQIFNWHEAVPIGDMVFNLREVEQYLHTERNNELVQTTAKAMNLNNLEDLKEELKELGFPKKVIDEMEKNMEKDLPEFKLRHTHPGDRGQVDMQLHFRQSAQSDYYYFNKYSVTLNNAKPLAEGHQYLVISPGDKGKSMMRRFETPHEAIAYFKEQDKSELAVGKIDGKELAFKTTLATRENGKENYVERGFERVYRGPVISQMVYLDRGQGFTAEQAANLIQGRAVYRDNMANLGGEIYKAWIELDLRGGKGRSGNYSTKQYHDPSYGFDLNKTLERYRIKELADPAKLKKLEASVRNGYAPLVTVDKGGEEMKVKLVVAPRFSELNFYSETGKSEKREQFMTPKAQEQLQAKVASRQKAVEQGMEIGR